MNTTIEIIKAQDQRYPTCGDYQMVGSDLKISISQTGDVKYNFLISLHEFIEAHLCYLRNIPFKEIDTFDINFEKERELGWHELDAEPGHHKHSPYRKEHKFSEKIEKIVAKNIGVDWKEYEKAIYNL